MGISTVSDLVTALNARTPGDVFELDPVLFDFGSANLDLPTDVTLVGSTGTVLSSDHISYGFKLASRVTIRRVALEGTTPRSLFAEAIDDVTLDGVSTSSSTSMQFNAGGTNLTVTNCRLVQTELSSFIGIRAFRGLVFRGNRIDYKVGRIAMSYMVDGLVEDNDITVYSQGTTETGGLELSCSVGCRVRNNRITWVAPAEGGFDPNSDEMIMTQGQSQDYSGVGKVVGTSGDLLEVTTDLTFPAGDALDAENRRWFIEGFDNSRKYCLIIGGAADGQYRSCERTSTAGVLKLATPLDIAPTVNSKIVVFTTGSVDLELSNNLFAGGGVGIQFFCGCVGAKVRNNVFIGAGGVLMVSRTEKAEGAPFSHYPLLGVEIVDNRIYTGVDAARRPAPIILRDEDINAPLPAASLIAADRIEIRRNRIQGQNVEATLAEDAGDYDGLIVRSTRNGGTPSPGRIRSVNLTDNVVVGGKVAVNFDPGDFTKADGE